MDIIDKLINHNAFTIDDILNQKIAISIDNEEEHKTVLSKLKELGVKCSYRTYYIDDCCIIVQNKEHLSVWSNHFANFKEYRLIKFSEIHFM